jgi:hypothetical protein
VAGYVAEELWQHDLNNHSFSEIPFVASSELISARIEGNCWANINDATEAVENARKVLKGLSDPLSTITGFPAAETIALLEEIRIAEQRAARILWRRWEAVRVIAKELHQWHWVLGCDIRDAIGAKWMKHASDE